MQGERHEGRTILAIGGGDRRDFLQGLVTNDVGRLDEGPVYAALLTPQGKYMADFILVEQGGRILLDIATPLARDVYKKLSMYKLRADVTLEEAGLSVLRGTGAVPDGAVPDPRHPALGWRLYTEAEGAAPAIDWDAIRVAHCIPETGIELVPGETFILEAGFERLNGVDHRKGCYVGQEVTARMKHKTELRKGLVTVAVEGSPPPPGTAIEKDGKAAGTLYTMSGDRGIAHLRYDRAGPDMQAGEATVSWHPEAPPGSATAG